MTVMIIMVIINKWIIFKSNFKIVEKISNFEKQIDFLSLCYPRGTENYFIYNNNDNNNNNDN